MSNRRLAGRYELIEKIGEGGMAIVYKGKDTLLNRYVSIKILRPEYTKDEKFIESFLKESQAAAGLIHPNIVGVYDVGREGNIHYIVMELVNGKPLSEIISEKGRLDYKEAIEFTIQIAQALSVAHRNQIVHRDVKPHNVLVTSHGIAKLADFGIAKAVSAATIVGGDDKVMGSVHYFSPEQARGAYVDERSDIYSLGVVLYEMLTGHVPFDGSNPVSIALMHINDILPSVSKEVTGLPPQLEKIIRKATEKYQSNRYKTVDEMIEDLKSIEYISNIMGKKAFPNYYNTKTDINIIQDDVNPILESIDNPVAENIPVTEAGRDTSRPVKKPEKTGVGGFFTRADTSTKIFVIGGLAVLAIIFMIFLGTLLGWFGESAKLVEIPKFVGMKFDEAVTLANESGLKIERSEDVYSPDYEEGLVCAQDPTEGTQVSEGKVIMVNVSKGKRDGIMPKIEGKMLEKGQELLESYGFAIGTIVQVSSHLPEGQIVKQSVKAGDKASVGTIVNVEVSDGKGKEMVTVPNLINRTPEEADTLLTVLGLEMGEVSYEEMDDMAENIVFWQSVPANTEVEKGTKIDVKASKGIKPEGSGNGPDYVEPIGENTGEPTQEDDDMPSDDER